MKFSLITLALAATLVAADSKQMFTGVITDTLCGAKHNMHGHSDSDCVKMCVKGSGQFALFDGENVFRLNDQKMSANFAAQRVKVTGALDEKNKLIKVSSIQPAGAN
ncbi:MAG: hypothetical protein JO307_21640 [Bryobacterales bacterium]|nr:hypothetical protein [Bryobacterales bacterium]MBV9398305.1 hypothetical protein [Bryobacterales bacterium]